MTLSEELRWRGFVNQTTFKDITAIDGDPITFYWGVDPSSDSMTVGNLAAAMMVRQFMVHGHRAILLVGGATGLIGDPDGKKQERDLKELEEIDRNVAGLTAQYKTVFAGQDFETVNNHDWFKDINYVDFLRTIGKHLSMTQLLDREFVQSRIGEGAAGLSYAEFSYSLIQGYDFLHLYREKGATLQVCGADQWGNSLAGVEIIRKLDGGEAHVYSTPLIVNKSTGVKFGKSEEGAIWLDEAKTSAFKFYQFWLNCDDEGVADYLKVYTLIQPQEYDALMAEFKQNPQNRAAQKYLAYEVTKLVHGEQKANSAKSVSEVLFGSKDFTELSEADVQELAKELPVVSASSITEALVGAELAASNSEANRFISSGAVSVNGEKVDSETELSSLNSVYDYKLLKRGKNSFALIK
ncbi:tyrosine--tRNA ligase [Candidatus Saccharibacteria bacterium]|nr:tyrosine--tRNA ligase [Candidatus Saccharibacteria bacterium]